MYKRPETRIIWKRAIGLIWLDFRLYRDRRIQEVTGKALGVTWKGLSQTLLPRKPMMISKGVWESV